MTFLYLNDISNTFKYANFDLGYNRFMRNHLKVLMQPIKGKNRIPNCFRCLTMTNIV